MKEGHLIEDETGETPSPMTKVAKRESMALKILEASAGKTPGILFGVAAIIVASAGKTALKLILKAVGGC